jgi:hypothetical protein
MPASPEISREPRPAPTIDARLRAYMPREVGSEGYGPSVMAALAQEGAAVDAHWAALQLSRCKQVQRDAQSIYSMRADNTNPAVAQGWDRTLDHIQREQQRCQTITPDLEQRYTELLLKAVVGGETDASVDYLNAVRRSANIDVAHRPVVLAALRKEGDGGNPAALMILAHGEPELSESAVHRSAYRAAYEAVTELRPDGLKGVMTQVLQKLGVPESEWSSLSVFKREPESAESRQMAAAIVENFKHRQARR